MPRRYWLMKSEPDVFSFDDLMARRDHTDCWDGVRNYVARNNMKQMKVGDRVLFYHSSTQPPHVAGVAEVVREAYPDPSAWDRRSPYFDPKSTPDAPRWLMVDIRGLRRLEVEVTLAELRENPRLGTMKVVQKGQRVSVLPVTAQEFEEVLRMGRKTSE